MTTLRTFIAVALDAELRDNLGRLQDRLREQVAPRSVRWVRPASIHLTLKFLGDTPLDKVDEIQAALARASAGIEPFAFSASGMGCFPNSRRPRVVWVGLEDPAGALVRLRDAVEVEVAPLGYPTERRSFTPHLTLGRVQRRATKSEAREIGQVATESIVGTLGTVAVSTLSFIKSDLQPSGAVYTTLFEAPLGGP